MVALVYGLFLILHGLVHLWYVTLSQRWVAFQPDMGWTGNSWLFTNLLGDGTTRILATMVFSVATLAFVIGGIGVFAQSEWWSAVVIGAAAISGVGILLFWDGSSGMLVQNGLLGLVIDIAVLAAIFLLNWPSRAF